MEAVVLLKRMSVASLCRQKPPAKEVKMAKMVTARGRGLTVRRLLLLVGLAGS